MLASFSEVTNRENSIARFRFCCERGGRGKSPDEKAKAMARKLDNGYDFFASQEELDFFLSTQPLEPETLAQEWMRRDPRWTTDRLVDKPPETQGTRRNYDEGHL